MPLSFAVTWDYRCPFARNAHEHVLAGLAAGADWDVTFVPFSLGQVHVEEGAASVWERPEQDSGILALQAGVVVRDEFPDEFLAVHRALFALKHDDGEKLSDRAIVARRLNDHGIDVRDVFDHIDSGKALEKIREEHERYAQSHDVWGVPTFIVGDQAVFVRLNNRPEPGPQVESIKAIERVVDLAANWTDLNEFKHTTVAK